MRSFVAALAVLFVGGHAHAGMLGDTVRVQYFFPGSNVLLDEDVVVGPGVELDDTLIATLILVRPWQLDLGDASISFRQGPLSSGAFYGSADFNGWLFSSMDLGAPIVGFNLTSFGISGLDSSLVSFTSDSIRINLQSLAAGDLNGWDLEILTGDTPVPEPGSLGLLGLGLAGLGLSRRRKAA